MKPVAIENPIINSPFDEPGRHFRFDDDGITDDLVPGRRPSSFFIPIASPRHKTRQLTFDTEWAKNRAKENDDINFIRSRVKLWRGQGYHSITPVTRALLEYWQDKGRERRLFFCQVEALETLIYLTEAASRSGDHGIMNKVKEALDGAGTTLPRLACKMATGSGKTAVMAMIIAWQTLNKRHASRDARFSDSFLVVAPGITIRDRLRVLLPSDPSNYYQALDLVPPEYRGGMGSARIVITNYHAFKPRDRGEAGRLTKDLLAGGRASPFIETPAQVVRRVCRELGRDKEVVVLNDEAHHCYRSKPAEEKLTGDERKEAERREEAARLWLTGLEWVHEVIGVKTAYDLSATPFYLKGSGYPEGTLFPWTVSDFSLIDAIESGIVKVPRVPVQDNGAIGSFPVYRNLWPLIREGLPKKGRGAGDDAERKLPPHLEGALHSLYRSYEKRFEAWEKDTEARANGRTPPVFIVVCCNTSVSKMVFDWIGGRETGKTHPDGSAYVAPGNLPLFSNAEANRWLARPNTILVDSEQFDSDEGMSPEFKKLAALQIEEFKEEYRKRFPGRDASDLTDEDLMREVLNTVGKPGKLGEGVRCVVSVSMLTEGWDANTVTHILGVRAFGTQLLCEQVVGRGLRRMSYDVGENGHFSSEYAEVYGVPFSFIPCAGIGEEREKDGRPRPGRVRATPERLIGRPWLEITFPRLAGYRYQVPPDRLEARFSDESRLALSTEQLPTWTENAPIVGESEHHTLDGLKGKRGQEVAFHLARRVLSHYYPAGIDEAGRPEGQQVWLFPQLLAVARRWMEECLTCKDETFPGLLLLAANGNLAAEKIHRAIATSPSGERLVRAILQRPDESGSTAAVSFDTSRDRYTTDATKSHVNFVTCDSGWEAKFAQSLERMPEVVAYVKNYNLGFKIPYTFQGSAANYLPDYIVRLDDGRGVDDPLNAVVEISGREMEQKEAKVDTACKLWVPAVNAEGRFGRWAFLEITDPYSAQGAIRGLLASAAEAKEGKMGKGAGMLSHTSGAGLEGVDMQPIIRKTAGVLGGDARIRDTRIAVWMLVRAKREGIPDEKLRTWHVTPLTEADLAAAWDYALKNPAEIEKAIRENEDE